VLSRMLNTAVNFFHFAFFQSDELAVSSTRN